MTGTAVAPVRRAAPAGTGAAGRSWAWRRHSPAPPARSEAAHTGMPVGRAGAPSGSPSLGCVPARSLASTDSRRERGGELRKRHSRRAARQGRQRTGAPAWITADRPAPHTGTENPAPAPSRPAPPAPGTDAGADTPATATGTRGLPPARPVPCRWRRHRRYGAVSGTRRSANRHGAPADTPGTATGAPGRATGTRRAVAAARRPAAQRGQPAGAGAASPRRLSTGTRTGARPRYRHRQNAAVAALPDQEARVPACRRRIGPDAPCPRAIPSRREPVLVRHTGRCRWSARFPPPTARAAGFRGRRRVQGGADAPRRPVSSASAGEARSCS